MNRNRKLEVLATSGSALLAGVLMFSIAVPGQAQTSNPWMSPTIVAEQATAAAGQQKYAVANRRARMLISAMTLEQKMQQLSGSRPEILVELPHCYGARHVDSIPELNIPTFRITNGPVGVGQNDCVAASVAEDVRTKRVTSGAAYTHPTSAKATALPSAIAAAASFDPAIAARFGTVIATEMNNLGLHVFEAPGANLARLPILGRNFEYFGEDPFLTEVMAVAETKAVQDRGLIAMVKHFAANEQETNRQTIQTNVDRQTLREIYLLPFEMAVKDANIASVMCAYNYVNGASSCESRELLTDVLRRDWGFTGYVQSDFFAMKSTAPTMKAGMDHEMPLPTHWSTEKLKASLAAGELVMADFDRALERRYTQAFNAGIFDRPLAQTPIDFVAGGAKAREIGTRGAVLLQNNGALPLSSDVRSVVLIGKASQVYARQAVAGGALTGRPMGSGGGSSDVVPPYTVTPLEGLRNGLGQLGNGSASVKLILVDDANSSATIDGTPASFAEALAQVAGAEAVIMMAGTISEEGADRATFLTSEGRALATSAASGTSLDWYADRSDVIAVSTPEAVSATAPSQDGSIRATVVKSSNSVAMIKAIMAARSTTSRTMAQKAVLVLKDNAGVAMDPSLVGRSGPAILETWFPGQEDGNIVADLLFGRSNPSGKLPVSFPYIGKGFLDSVTAEQFPGTLNADRTTQTVTYSEKLHVGYRWYDANVSGRCAVVNGRNPCLAFPFGHGLSYTRFSIGRPRLTYDPATKAWRAHVAVTNIGKRTGIEVVQVYAGLPGSADAVGAAQPPRRLVAFSAIELRPGERKDVELAIDPAASHHPLSVWSIAENKWLSPPGKYTIWVGRSSSPRDLAVAGSFALLAGSAIGR